MLRSLVEACRTSYTCSCIIQKTALGRHMQKGWPALLTSLQTAPRLQIHTAPVCLTLDKDVKTRKMITRTAQLAKEENLDDEIDADAEEIDLEGLTEAGVTIPSLETHAMLIGGVRYDELPIVHIKSSSNNTIILITDYSGLKKICRASCGTEGFRHVKKSTNVAAQATGLSIGNAALRRGLRHVRVAVKGLGAGRLASIKGLQMAGLKVVSITDTTPIPFNGPRPRKARRI